MALGDLFEEGVPDFFEIVEYYVDELHKGKLIWKLHSDTFFGLTYESQANITARVDYIQTVFVPDTSNRFRSWAVVWDHSIQGTIFWF